MVVNVLYFATLREQSGCSERLIHLPEGATVLDAVESSGFKDAASSIMVAVNEAYVGLTQTLKDGDTVALIPPLGGG